MAGAAHVICPIGTGQIGTQSVGSAKDAKNAKEGRSLVWVQRARAVPRAQIEIPAGFSFALFAFFADPLLPRYVIGEANTVISSRS